MQESNLFPFVHLISQLLMIIWRISGKEVREYTSFFSSEIIIINNICIKFRFIQRISLQIFVAKIFNPLFFLFFFLIRIFPNFPKFVFTRNFLKLKVSSFFLRTPKLSLKISFLTSHHLAIFFPFNLPTRQSRATNEIPLVPRNVGSP